MKMRVLASLFEEIDKGSVWISEMKLQPRAVVKITNPGLGRSVYCQAFLIDQNFVQFYNDRSQTEKLKEGEAALIANYWFRKNLGNLTTNTVYDIDVKTANCMYGQFQSTLHHRQAAVRICGFLAAISILLGVASTILSVLGVAMCFAK